MDNDQTVKNAADPRFKASILLIGGGIQYWREWNRARKASAADKAEYEREIVAWTRSAVDLISPPPGVTSSDAGYLTDELLPALKRLKSGCEGKRGAGGAKKAAYSHVIETIEARTSKVNTPGAGQTGEEGVRGEG